MNYVEFNTSKASNLRNNLRAAKSVKGSAVKFYDITCIGNVSLFMAPIKREGMEIFAVKRINSDNTTDILRTAMDEKIITTMFYDELRKAAKKGEA